MNAKDKERSKIGFLRPKKKNAVKAEQRSTVRERGGGGRAITNSKRQRERKVS